MKTITTRTNNDLGMATTTRIKAAGSGQWAVGSGQWAVGSGGSGHRQKGR